jgi:hypothetical protein
VHCVWLSLLFPDADELAKPAGPAIAVGERSDPWNLDLIDGGIRSGVVPDPLNLCRAGWAAPSGIRSARRAEDFAGIETIEPSALLQALGCDEGLGFHFSKPLEASAAMEFLRSRKSAQTDSKFAAE